MHDGINSSELFNNSYTVYRCDRVGKKGGGVLIAVKNVLISTKIEFRCNNTNTNNNYESLCVKLLFGGKVFYLIAVYFPPNSVVNLFESFYSTLEECNIYNNIIVIGDFNMPLITGTDITLAQHAKYKLLSDFMSLYNFSTLNNIKNKNSRTLDLVLSNVPNVIVERNSDPIIMEDDHHPALTLSIEFKFYKQYVEEIPNYVYNFKNANFLLLYNLLRETNWKVIENISNVNDAVKIFYNNLYDSFNATVPKKVFKKSNYPCWFNSEIIKMLKLKEYHRKRMKRCKESGIVFKNLRKEVKKTLNFLYKKYINNVENSILSDPKNFWSFIKNKRSKNSSVLHDMTLGNSHLAGSQNISNGFANFFKSVYKSTNACYSIPEEVLPMTAQTLNLSTITENEYKTAIKKLKPKRSSGPDGIPPYIFKGCAEVLMYPLCTIFNLIIREQIFPTAWKLNKVCPIFKSGDVKKIENYRPISILCAPAKIFEQILYNRIYTHVKSYISEKQHGFLSKRSTLTNMMNFVQWVDNTLNARARVDIIYTDFSKAFDSINHDILLQKLAIFGFSKEMLKLTLSYLENRKQYVTYNHCMSHIFKVNSGVPQGSNLGPLFFLLFINDLPDRLKFSDCLLYADDLKMFKKIECREDELTLQSDINNIYNWSIINDLAFNVKKCCVMSISRVNIASKPHYSMNNETLIAKSTHADLGVLLSDSWSFNCHIDKIVNEAYRNLGFIFRNSSELRNIFSLIMLFNCLVRSKLEYLSQIWSPYFQYQQNKIEIIQKKFLRYLYYKKHKKSSFSMGIHYEDLLEEFNFTRLATRREIALQILLYKMINFHIDNSQFLEYLNFNIKKSNLRTRPLFVYLVPRSLSFKNSILLRMCSTYNKISSKVPDLDFALDFSKYKQILHIELR